MTKNKCKSKSEMRRLEHQKEYEIDREVKEWLGKNKKYITSQIRFDKLIEQIKKLLEV